MVMSFGSWPKGQDLRYKRPKWASFAGWQGAPLEIGWGALSHGSRATAPPHREEPVEVARISVPDVSWTSIWGGIPGLSHREEAPGKTQDTLKGLCLSACLATPWGSPGGAGGSVWGEGSLEFLAETAAPTTRLRISGLMMDGWMLYFSDLLLLFLIHCYAFWFMVLFFFWFTVFFLIHCCTFLICCYGFWFVVVLFD